MPLRRQTSSPGCSTPASDRIAGLARRAHLRSRFPLGTRGRAAYRGALPCPWRTVVVCRRVVVLIAESCRVRRGEFSSYGAFKALSHGKPSVTRQVSATPTATLRDQ